MRGPRCNAAGVSLWRLASASIARCFHTHDQGVHMSALGAMYLDDAFRSLRGMRRQADTAMEQLSDEQFFAALDAESNSVAVIVQHMAGNTRSRFTAFLTTDGEKPDRNPAQE